MDTKNKMIEQRIYVTPELQQVLLDNEISLALESFPPGGPYEGVNQLSKPDCLQSDPFKSNLS